MEMGCSVMRGFLVGISAAVADCSALEEEEETAAVEAGKENVNVRFFAQEHGFKFIADIFLRSCISPLFLAAYIPFRSLHE
jgi:hypothetical protein